MRQLEPAYLKAKSEMQMDRGSGMSMSILLAAQASYRREESAELPNVEQNITDEIGTRREPSASATEIVASLNRSLRRFVTSSSSCSSIW